MTQKNNIHPTAIVHENARLGENNYVGPYCLIGPNVQIGSDNRFEAYVSIGTPAEHRDYFTKEHGQVSIGSRNIIREFVTINSGTNQSTILENDITILRGSHVGHDSCIESKVTMSCNVLIGGNSIISEGANLGLSAVVHQHRIVGSFSMIGMNSAVTKNIPPFVIAYGSPCHAQKINRIGLLRNGIEECDLLLFENWFLNTKGLFELLIPIEHDFNQYITSYIKKRDELYHLIRNTH